MIRLARGGAARDGARRAAGWRLLTLVTVAITLLSGCGFKGVYDMPLPGGADVGDDPYRVRVRFADVLDLVPNAAVRVNNVPVGRVERIGLAPNSWQAEVTVVVNDDVKLPANATARLRQSSLLGEKYVELAGPAEPARPRGELLDGDLITLDRTNRNPQVEEVLGALSMLLNGGGVAQLQNITRELNNALAGRESDTRELLGNIDELVAGLDAQRDDISRALDGVNRLSANLQAQRDNIDTALRDLEPGLRVLNEQRHQLVTMLESLDRLSRVGTDVVNSTRDDLVHNLRMLRPTLQRLVQSGDDLPKALEGLLTYPFTDEVTKATKGDYVNLFIDADLNLTRTFENIGRSRQPLIAPPDLPVPLPPRPEQPGTDQPGQDQPQQRPPDEKDDSSGGGLLDDLFGGD